MAKVKDIKQHMDPIVMDLGGRERVLQFDMNAFAELEKRYGSIDNAMDQMMAGKITDIRNILWAALVHDEIAEFDEDSGEPIKYNITPYQVGSWIKNPSMLKDVSINLGKAMSDGMPAPEDLPEEVKAQLKAKGIDIDAGKLIKNVPQA